MIFQTLAGILYYAATREDYIDPCQVEEILGLTEEEVTSLSPDTGQSPKRMAMHCITLRQYP